MTQSSTVAKPAKWVRKMAREPMTEASLVQQPDDALELAHAHIAAAPAASPTKAPTKTDIILGLLRREQGATLENLVAATGWLPHTTRAALTGIKRKGHVLSSEKVNGARIYRAITAEVGP